MADTFTDSLGFVLQDIGGNLDIWGNKLNDDVIQLVEDKFVGRTSIATTGGTTTVTQVQARKKFIDVSGVLVSNATLEVPNKKNVWHITNNCTGDFAVLVKTAAGGSTSVPAGTTKEIYCDGLDGVFRTDRNEVGEMKFVANNAVPSGYFEADGVAVSRTGRGVDLFAKTGTAWGIGDGSTTFNLPNGKTDGKFLRSRTNAVALATSQSSQNLAHTHPGSTATQAGTFATTTNGSHSHGVSGNVNLDIAGNSALGIGGNQGVTQGPGGGGANMYAGNQFQVITAAFSNGLAAAAGDHSHTVTLSGNITATIASDGGSEARPTNLSAILVVRY